MTADSPAHPAIGREARGNGRYLAKRTALFVPTLIAASVVVFLVMRVLPGDVTLVILSGSPHTVEMRESLREELGLNRSLPFQYVTWLWSMVNGQFGGNSLESREPMRSVLARQLPVTLLLTLYTVLLSVLTSVPLGVLSAVKKDRWPDYLVRIASLGGLALPHVWIALLVILALLLVFRWSAPIIYTPLLEDPVNHFQMMIWPVLILAWQFSSHIVRTVRSGVIEELDREYVSAARSKGVSERTVVLRYALRGALVPAINMIGLQFGTLLGGTLVLETVFGLPGIGRGLIQAAVARDYPVIQSVATLLVLLYLVVNLTVDMICRAVDPRISRADGKGGE